MKNKTHSSQTMPGVAGYGVSSLAVAMGFVALAAMPAMAQDAPPTTPEQPATVSAPAAENEFEAMRAAGGTAAPTQAPDPLAELTSPTPVGEDTLITNQPVVTDAATTPELSPVQDAATAEPPAMPQVATQQPPLENTAEPVNTTVAAPIAGEAQPATAETADPMAPFRAQQAIVEAQQRNAAQQQGNDNPLGPAAQLPLNNRVSQSSEELQAQLEAEAAAQQERMKQQIFDQSLESLLPLTPDQTRSVLDNFRISREAAETPIAVPKARTTVENVSLDPSQPPLSIKTAPGYVTTLTILDMTGAPWAIQDISWAGKFEVTTPEEGGHVIRITPMSAHGVGNISIRLVDLITPVTFSIDTGLDVVDYRFDARIPKAGPLAKTPLIANGGLSTVAGSDENLMRVLDGTSVEGVATRLTLDGVDGATTAYSINDTMYLRTPLTLLSPSWQSSATSADGMNVYTLKATPVILLSDKGRMVKARLKASE